MGDRNDAITAFRLGLVAADQLSQAEKDVLRSQHRTALARLRDLHRGLGFDPLECCNPNCPAVSREEPGDDWDRAYVDGDVATIQDGGETFGFVSEGDEEAWAQIRYSSGVVSHRYDTEGGAPFWGRRYYRSLERALAVESILSVSIYAMGRARGLDLPGVREAMTQAMAQLDIAQIGGATPQAVAAPLNALPGTRLEFRSLRDEVVACWEEDGRREGLWEPASEAGVCRPPKHLHRLRSCSHGI